MIEQPDVREVADHPSEDQLEHGHAKVNQANELAQARERLSFYESFDSLIRDNVLRSGELLRQVAAERERTDQQLLTMQAQLDERLVEQRSALAAIATGLAGLQARLADVVDQVAASLVALGPSPGSAAAGEASDTELGEGGGSSDLDVEAVAGDPGVVQAAMTTARYMDGGQAIVASPSTEEHGSGGRGGGETVAPVRRTIDVIVHGVPKAATALSLQRHLQELRGVETVDVREYVSGVLRLQMVATEFGPDDFRHWPGADGLQTVTSRDNVLELRLVTADGF